MLTRGLQSRGGVLVGVGDDCAVLGKRGQKEPFTLFKTDCIVENIHYLPDADSVKVGWKAMARAVSDVAAMGGWPTAALATVVLHPDTPLAFAQGIYRGFRKAGREFDFPLVGGETSRAPRAGGNVISVSMLGSVEPSCCVLRSTARAGDAVFVTGRLGGSGNGRHLNFRPRLKQARWLVQNCKPTAMMDLSDGLAKDLARLTAASGLGHTIDRDALPRNRGCSIDQALHEGEDYELLLTLRPNAAKTIADRWKLQFPRVLLTRVGTVLAEPAAPPRGGWDHFA